MIVNREGEAVKTNLDSTATLQYAELVTKWAGVESGWWGLKYSLNSSDNPFHPDIWSKELCGPLLPTHVSTPIGQCS